MNKNEIYLFTFFSIYFSDSPEVEIDKGWVHGGVGHEAVISCLVYGNPPPQVMILVDAQPCLWQLVPSGKHSSSPVLSMATGSLR